MALLENHAELTDLSYLNIVADEVSYLNMDYGMD